MRTLSTVVVAAALMALGWPPRPAPAQPLKYLGKHAAEARGLIEQGGVQYEVQPGTEVPGWGRVQEVADEALVIDHHLTDAEKDDLRARGAAVYDIRRARVPREDLKFIRVE